MSSAPPEDAIEEVALLLAADLAPLTPPPSLKTRLLATLASADRFAPFLDDLTRMFDLPVATMRELLARIDGSEWETKLLGVRLEGAELFHFRVGPRLAAGAAGGVLRMRPDVTFPRHRHLGAEVTYVLEGGYCTDGRVHGPGSCIEMPGGSEHDYRSAPGRDLVMMVLHRGVELLGA
jgi:hypothetical protein